MNTAVLTCMGETPFCNQTMTCEGIKLDYTLTIDSEFDDLGHIIVIYNDEKISFNLDNVEMFNITWNRKISKFDEDDDKVYESLKERSWTCLSNMYEDLFLEIYKIIQEEL